MPVMAKKGCARMKPMFSYVIRAFARFRLCNSHVHSCFHCRCSLCTSHRKRRSRLSLWSTIWYALYDLAHDRVCVCVYFSNLRPATSCFALPPARTCLHVGPALQSCCPLHAPFRPSSESKAHDWLSATCAHPIAQTERLACITHFFAPVRIM
jgi:hypothetical protein